MKQSLNQIVEDLVTNLRQYREDAIKNIGAPNPKNEWLLQIADIYEAAYGEELDLTAVVVD